MMLTHGFKQLRTSTVEELKSNAILYKHVKSGAELLVMENDDENKVFGITFRTPPQSSNGIAHIMEHCVLAGSRKYPVKEPFIELVKGSLKTFLNAFTYPDKTIYPVASTNTQDLYNMMDVYLDAVFHPLLTPHHLDQEGWHYDLDDINDPLKFKGVVFNEMKGAFSSPEGVLGRYSQETLFSLDHPYGVDSGGDPAHIPDLTYEEFLDFHKNYYHPSNARIYCYGDDNHIDRLKLLDKYLSEFDAIEVDSNVELYPMRDESQRHVFPYAVDPQEEENAKNYVALNWLLPEITDSKVAMGLSVLTHVLSGTVGSPLQKRLVDSGLGEDTLGGGFASYLRQYTFSSGLKGVKVEDIPKVEAIIIDILEDLATNGIDPATIEASVNTIEFRLRENNTGNFPRGLVWMMAAMDRWLYDEDPIESMRYEGPLNFVKEAIKEGGYFESLIREFLLDNQHRTTVVLEPDPELSQRMEQKELDRLAKAKSEFSEEELLAIIENAKALRLRQETPDDPAELAKIPSLKLDDIERDVKSIPIAVEDEGGTEIISHDLFTNGICYFRIGMNLRVIPQELLPYVPLLSYAITEVGTENEDFVQLSQRIGRTTGGVSASRFIADHQTKKKAIAWMFLRGKSTIGHSQDMLDIMRDVLLSLKLDNQQRFRQMVLEEKAGEESGIVPSGHGVVMGRLRAHFSEAGWVNERMGGVSYLAFLRQLIEDVDNDWPSVLAKLEKIIELLVNRNNMLCDITLDAENQKIFRPQLSKLLEQFPAAPVVLQDWEKGCLPQNEGLTVPAQVNYVGKAANIYELGYEYHGSINVITNTLRTGYLWEKVRMQGGAYGAFMPFNSHSGVLALISYRDPNVTDTIAVYDELASHLRELPLIQESVEKAIIGVIGSMDSHQLPDAKGYTALSRHLHGITDEYRQMRRDEVLNTTESDFRRFADIAEAVKEHGHVVVLGSSDAIQTATAQRPDWLEVTKIF